MRQNGEPRIVQGTDTEFTSVEVFNLSVQELRNYCVGTNQLVVHNRPMRAGRPGNRPDLGKPGSKRNPDGTPKDPADQLQQLEEAQSGGQLIDEVGRSKQNMKHKFDNYDPSDWGL